MGYTHYQKHETPFNDDEWSQIVDAVDKLVTQADKEGLPLSADNGETQLSNHQRMERIWHSQDGQSADIMLNGMGDDAHETFCIFKNGPKGSGGFEFCKTARKPYDRFVVAALAWVETHFPGRLNVSSDGNPDEWRDGLEFARRTFPDTQIDLPPGVARE